MPVDFWESLRLGFMQLREECAINPPIAPAGRLTAIWTAQPTRNEWRLYYHDGKDGSGVAKRFEWHAQSAAARLGFVGGDQKAVWFWLDLVRRDAPDSHVRTTSIRGPDGIDKVYSHEILDICGLSAEYCRRCEAEETRRRLVSALVPAADRAHGAEGPRVEKDNPPWRVIRDEFLAGAKEYPGLLAHWEHRQGLWSFQTRVDNAPSPEPADHTAEKLFKDIARSAIRLLGERCEVAPAWHVWLDRMRIGKRGFQRTWRARTWSQVRVFTETGVLPPGLILLEDGTIRRVFEASAAYCEDLSDNELARPNAAHTDLPLKRGDETSPQDRPSTEEGATNPPIKRAKLSPQPEAVSTNINRPRSDSSIKPVISTGRTEIEVSPPPASLLVPTDRHVRLLEAVLEKRTTTLEKWAAEHRIGRTTLFDWKSLSIAGCPLTGKVSAEKSTEIELAIEDDAKALGLLTRTDSD